MLKTMSNNYFDVMDVWRQGIFPLAGHLQGLDFDMLFRRGIVHDLYGSYFFSFIFYIQSIIYL